MKLKTTIIVLLLTFTGISSTHAATEVTGDVYGKAFRTMEMNDAGSLYGISIDDVGQTTEDCDITAQTCAIKGFTWSDVVGWTYWDGKGIQSEVPGYPDEYIAKVAFNGNMGGFIWGEKYGWIQLSACSGLDAATCGTKSFCSWSGSYCEASSTTRLPDVASQDMDNWGVYVDLCPTKTSQATCEANPTVPPYCNWSAGDSRCVFNSAGHLEGEPLGGYAWSQYLGWIKFGPEAGDSDFTGAFTNWFPDLTPPDFGPTSGSTPLPTPIKAWIPNESSTGAISWFEFSKESESFVDLNASKITVTPDANAAFATCPDVTSGPYLNEDAVFSPTGTGEWTLTIPEIGLIGTPPNGFCKYDLSGALYNAAGIGLYFGADANSLATNDGVNLSSPGYNIVDNSPITLFIRAGEPNAANTTLTSSGNNALANGSNSITITFSPADVGGNPIMTVNADLEGNLNPVLPDNRVRNVELLYNLNNSLYSYDSVDWLRDLILGRPVPIEVEGATYSQGEPLVYPPDPTNTGDSAGNQTLNGNSYLLSLTGYAPTTTDGNDLELTNIDLYANDLALPALSPSHPELPANPLPTVISNPAYPILPFTYNYDPIIEVTDGVLNTPSLSLSQTTQATFDYQNNSPALTIGEYSFDNILDFHDTGIGAELMEVQDINLVGAPADLTSRTDPEGGTRFGLIYSATDTAGINQFHSNTTNFHAPLYAFDTVIDNDGEYQINGNFFVEPTDPCIGTGTCPFVDNDRSDLLSSVLTPSASDTFTFSFTPTRFIGSSESSLAFSVHQYVAYNYTGNGFGEAHAIIYPAPAYITDEEVKSIGLDTSGTVGGSQVYDSVAGRDLSTITTTSSADLRREIRRNVATLTRNMTACDNPADLTGTLTTTPSDCVLLDATNNTIVAFYTGNTITLGENASTTLVPNYKYTIILVGADLNLEGNVSYGGNPDSSLGIIVMKDENGNGGNVYLDPAPTNMVGLLYAEGSLLSSPDAGSTLYYTPASPATSDLGNQLFWQGSIASRNTIGGASSLVVPDGVDCSPWLDDDITCSQGYDLDFTRRFTTLSESGSSYVPVGYLFSGGGSCTIGPVNCTLGPLPTTITLTSGSIDSSASKSLNTFFIERDNRPVPPGFSSKGGFTSSQTFR